MTDTSKQKQGLDSLDAKKRETLKRLALGAAFVVPIVTSVSLDGMTISKVHAAAPAGSDVRERKKKDKCNPAELGEPCDPECGPDACEMENAFCPAEDSTTPVCEFST